MTLPFTTIPSVLALAATAALTLPVSAQITGFDVDFDSGASDYTDNFKRWATDPDDPIGFIWSATGGVGGGGGLEVTNTAGNNIFYRPSPGSDATSTFDIAGQDAGASFGASIDFVWANTTATDLTVITFGLTANRLQNALSSSGSLGGSIIRNGSSTVTLRLRNNNSSAQSLTFDQGLLTAGNWYRLSFDFTKSETANSFDYGLSLLSLGADGTGTPTVFNDGSDDLAMTGSVSNSTLYGDSDVFFGYDIRDSSGSTGITHVDNFNVTGAAIPEPSVASLVGGLLTLLVAGGRRRSASRR